ncbi:hypothetical protein SE17_29530 [Kouleothrix aurantiaca]|jgi:hypothetical protein|uniref:Uncharacterized protein n=1 Tax=Kouleothrix aurantiaca TaxID=186479 RepID=A0A0P9F104_9CHLR|nr:hypothetical protein SE17_29530 [Kouleothrix aurantiaca]
MPAHDFSEATSDSPAERVTIAIHVADEHNLPGSTTIDRIVEAFFDQLDRTTVELRVIADEPDAR